MLGAVYKPGDAGDRIKEIQASLNRALKNKYFDDKKLLRERYTVRMAGEDEVPKLFIVKRGIELNLRDKHPNKWIANKDENSLQLPPEPLKVDGIYGQQTYATVLMFQIWFHLQETGTVDIVTLDKLEPMVPSYWLPATVMRWTDENLTYEFVWENTAEGRKIKAAFVAVLIVLFVALVALRVARALAKVPRLLTGLKKWLWPFEKVFLRTAHFAPALVIDLAGNFMFPVAQSGGDPFPYLNTFQTCGLWLSRAGLAYSSLVLMLVALAVVDGYRKRLELEEGAVEGIIRAVRRGILLTGLVLIFASMAGRNPMYFVGGLGAFMAVLILSFRDTILGLVASITIVSAKMLKEGDWIQMPGRAVDGTVLGITLNTVTVENFDKTLITIPTHTLLSESFKRVKTGDGRRIKRAILIDMHSIKPCTSEMIGRYEKIDLLREYIGLKKEEIEKANLGVDGEGSVLNSRRLTNIGTFRAYAEAYLAKHTQLHDEDDHHLCLVRQLDPGALGLPVEVYAFSIETGFKRNEAVQADIFDHLLSILPEFELRTFQNVPSHDAVS